jgi:hypothetical protein
MQTYEHVLPKMRITLLSAVTEFMKHSLKLNNGAYVHERPTNALILFKDLFPYLFAPTCFGII